MHKYGETDRCTKWERDYLQHMRNWQYLESNFSDFKKHLNSFSGSLTPKQEIEHLKSFLNEFKDKFTQEFKDISNASDSKLSIFAKYIIFFYEYYIRLLQRSSLTEFKEILDIIFQIFNLEIITKIPEILGEILMFLKSDMPTYYSNNYFILLIIRFCEYSNFQYFQTLIKKNQYKKQYFVDAANKIPNFRQIYILAIQTFQSNQVICDTLFQTYIESLIDVKHYINSTSITFPIAEFYYKSTPIAEDVAANDFIIENELKPTFKCILSNSNSLVEETYGCVNVGEGKQLTQALESLLPKEYDNIEYKFGDHMLFLISGGTDIPKSFEFQNSKFSLNIIIIEIDNGYYKLSNSYSSSPIWQIIMFYTKCVIYNVSRVK